MTFIEDVSKASKILDTWEGFLRAIERQKFANAVPGPVEVTPDIYELACRGDFGPGFCYYHSAMVICDGYQEKVAKHLKKTVAITTDDRSEPKDRS